MATLQWCTGEKTGDTHVVFTMYWNERLLQTGSDSQMKQVRPRHPYAKLELLALPCLSIDVEQGFLFEKRSYGQVAVSDDGQLRLILGYGIPAGRLLSHKERLYAHYSSRVALDIRHVQNRQLINGYTSAVDDMFARFCCKVSVSPDDIPTNVSCRSLEQRLDKGSDQSLDQSLDQMDLLYHEAGRIKQALRTSFSSPALERSSSAPPLQNDLGRSRGILRAALVRTPGNGQGRRELRVGDVMASSAGGAMMMEKLLFGKQALPELAPFPQVLRPRLLSTHFTPYSSTDGPTKGVASQAPRRFARPLSIAPFGAAASLLCTYPDGRCAVVSSSPERNKNRLKLQAGKRIAGFGAHRAVRYCATLPHPGIPKASMKDIPAVSKYLSDETWSVSDLNERATTTAAASGVRPPSSSWDRNDAPLSCSSRVLLRELLSRGAERHVRNADVVPYHLVVFESASKKSPSVVDANLYSTLCAAYKRFYTKADSLDYASTGEEGLAAKDQAVSCHFFSEVTKYLSGKADPPSWEEMWTYEKANMYNRHRQLVRSRVRQQQQVTELGSDVPPSGFSSQRFASGRSKNTTMCSNTAKYSLPEGFEGISGVAMVPNSSIAFPSLPPQSLDALNLLAYPVVLHAGTPPSVYSAISDIVDRWEEAGSDEEDGLDAGASRAAKRSKNSSLGAPRDCHDTKPFVGLFSTLDSFETDTSSSTRFYTSLGEISSSGTFSMHEQSPDNGSGQGHLPRGHFFQDEGPGRPNALLLFDTVDVRRACTEFPSAPGCAHAIGLVHLPCQVSSFSLAKAGGPNSLFLAVNSSQHPGEVYVFVVDNVRPALAIESQIRRAEGPGEYFPGSPAAGAGGLLHGREEGESCDLSIRLMFSCSPGCHLMANMAFVGSEYQILITTKKGKKVSVLHLLTGSDVARVYIAAQEAGVRKLKGTENSAGNVCGPIPEDLLVYPQVVAAAVVHYKPQDLLGPSFRTVLGFCHEHQRPSSSAPPSLSAATVTYVDTHELDDPGTSSADNPLLSVRLLLYRCAEAKARLWVIGSGNTLEAFSLQNINLPISLVLRKKSIKHGEELYRRIQNVEHKYPSHTILVGASSTRIRQKENFLLSKSPDRAKGQYQEVANPNVINLWSTDNDTNLVNPVVERSNIVLVADEFSVFVRNSDKSAIIEYAIC